MFTFGAFTPRLESRTGDRGSRSADYLYDYCPTTDDELLHKYASRLGPVGQNWGSGSLVDKDSDL